MKRLHKIYAICILTGIFSSCDLLEPEVLSVITEKDAFTNFNNLIKVRSHVFSYLPEGYNSIGNSWLAAASDEAEEVDDAQRIQNFNSGNWSVYSNPDEAWTPNYTGIRRACDFIQGTDTITYEEFRISDPTTYNARITSLKRWRAEMKFLRAFFYFELVKRYGGVPLITRKLDLEEDHEYMTGLPRESFENCIKYIITQCDEAEKDLPLSQAKADWGAPTKGAALALKARTLLYAASDLFNRPENNIPAEGYVGGNRTERWLQAANANKEVIYLNLYSLHSTYSSLFLLKATESKEVIFERRKGASSTFETANYPVGFQTGKTGTCPSQNLVDAYEMKDGKPFDWLNPAHAASPYADRDPRLTQTITVNNSTWKSQPVEIWEGGANGKPRNRASKTGYYLRKYVDEGLDLTKSQTSLKQWIFFRLAETYLNYAEAMNELYGPYDEGGKGLSACAAVNLIRGRAGVKMPALPTNLSKEEFTERLRNERRIELAFEDHRMWDVRRWMIAGHTLGGDLKGVSIKKGDTDAFTYTPIVVEKRLFDTKMNLYPIPQSEIAKSNKLEQNTGW